MLARLLGLPTSVCVTSYSQLHDVLRELRIIEVGRGSGMDTPPEVVELLPFVHELERNRSRAWELAEAAADRGMAVTDLEVHIPRQAIPVARRALEFLERADELCHRGLLMTLCADEDVAGFRRWMVSELEAQATGRSPVPYDPGGTRGH